MMWSLAVAPCRRWGKDADALVGTSVFCADPQRSCFPAGLPAWLALP